MARVDRRVTDRADKAPEKADGPSLADEIKASRVSREQAGAWLSKGGATVAKVRQPRIARRVVCAIAALTIVGSVWHIESDNSSFHHQRAANEQAITQLDQQLKDTKGAVPQVSTTGQTEKRWLADAQAAGVAVAKDQNSYTSVSGSDADAITADMASHLDDASQNARVPWYSMGDDTTRAVQGGTATYSWSYSPPFSFDGGTAKVSWVCREASDGRLLAYTTAVYHADTKKFSDVLRATTTLGSQLVKQTDEGQDATSASPTPAAGAVPAAGKDAKGGKATKAAAKPTAKTTTTKTGGTHK